jgi:hypothetical protein
MCLSGSTRVARWPARVSRRRSPRQKQYTFKSGHKRPSFGGSPTSLEVCEGKGGWLGVEYSADLLDTKPYDAGQGWAVLVTEKRAILVVSSLSKYGISFPVLQRATRRDR